MDERSLVDKEHEHVIAKKANFLYRVLQRLVDIIFTLAAENMSLRGHNEKPGVLGSGIFLSLVGIIAKYDPVLKEFLNKPKGSVRYLSPTIQNELITLLGKDLRQ